MSYFNSSRYILILCLIISCQIKKCIYQAKGFERSALVLVRTFGKNYPVDIFLICTYILHVSVYKKVSYEMSIVLMQSVS